MLQKDIRGICYETYSPPKIHPKIYRFRFPWIEDNRNGMYNCHVNERVLQLTSLAEATMKRLYYPSTARQPEGSRLFDTDRSVSAITRFDSFNPFLSNSLPRSGWNISVYTELIQADKELKRSRGFNSNCYCYPSIALSNAMHLFNSYLFHDIL